MALVELALMKRHLRVSHNDEDTEIETYLAAAEDVIVQYLDRQVYVGTKPSDAAADAIALPAAVRSAILLQAAELFERREPPESARGEAMLSPTVRRLLAPYRVWRTYSENDDAGS